MNYIGMPLYSYRIVLEGAHSFMALLPEKDPVQALTRLKSEEYVSWYYKDASNHLRSVAVAAYRIIGVEEAPAEAMIIDNKGGTLILKAYKKPLQKTDSTPAKIGRVTR